MAYKVYLSHPMSGLRLQEVYQYYSDIINRLKENCPNIEILHPLTGKYEYLKDEESLKLTGYDEFPLISAHAIHERDKWMVRQADVVLVDLNESEFVSIGCLFELAWADILGKYTIVVLNPNNPFHQHAFILEAADVFFFDLNDAIEYLKKLVNSEF